MKNVMHLAVAVLVGTFFCCTFCGCTGSNGSLLPNGNYVDCCDDCPDGCDYDDCPGVCPNQG